MGISHTFNNINVFFQKNPGFGPGLLICALSLIAIGQISIKQILIYLVHPLLNLISNLLLPLSGLLIAGVFSCPTKDSFLPWLEEMVNNAILYKESAYLNSYLNMPKVEDIPYFFHLGFCKIAVCNVEGNNKILFLGIFNTWIRIAS